MRFGQEHRRKATKLLFCFVGHYVDEQMASCCVSARNFFHGFCLPSISRDGRNLVAEASVEKRGNNNGGASLIRRGAPKRAIRGGPDGRSCPALAPTRACTHGVSRIPRNPGRDYNSLQRPRGTSQAHARNPRLRQRVFRNLRHRLGEPRGVAISLHQRESFMENTRLDGYVTPGGGIQSFGLFNGATDYQNLFQIQFAQQSRLIC